MERLTIHTRLGAVTVNINANSELVCKLNDEDVVKVYFSANQYVDVNIGDFVDVFGKRYFVNTVPIVKKLSSTLFEYEIVFEGLIYDLSKVAFLDTDDTGVHMSHEFYLIGNIQRFASVLQNNLDRVFGGGVWTVEVLGLDDSKVKNLNFSENNCLHALKKLCDEFKCEYEVVSTDGIHQLILREQIGGGGAITFAYGKGKGLYDIKRTVASNNNLTTRLYAFGGSRNIGPNYRNYSTRLKLPGAVTGTPTISISIDEHELVNSWWYIYGNTNAWNVRLQMQYDNKPQWHDYGETMPGSVFNLHYLTYPALLNPTAVRIKAWNTNGRYVYSDGSNEGWDIQVAGESYIDNAEAISRYGVIERVVIFEDIYPEREGTVTGLGDSILRFSDAEMFDLHEIDSQGNSLYLLSGLEAKISFRTGNLAGYEFTIADFDNATKTFTIQKYVDERGTYFPNPDNEAFQIQPGDKYALIDIRLPQNYIDDAENRLLTTAQDWLSRYSNDQVLYELSIDQMYAKQHNMTFGVGDAIGILDSDIGINEQIRIVEVRRNLVNEYAYTIKLANSTYIARSRQIKQGKIISAVQLKTSGVHADWNEQDPYEPGYIKNKPDLDAIADRHMTFPVSNKLFEVINHNLGKNPTVSVVDYDGEAVISDVEYIDNDTVKVSFTDFFTGKIIFN